MENKLIKDFEVYLQNDFRCNRQEIAIISVTHMENDDITLLLMNKNDGIGGHFVVFPLRSHHCKADYLEYDMAVPDDEYFAPPKYDIGEFAEFMDWCFKKGWRVRLDLSEIYLLREKRWINRFAIEQIFRRKGRITMKQVIFLSSAAAITAAAIFLFQRGRKKHPTIMTFRELYEDNAVDNGIYDLE